MQQPPDLQCRGVRCHLHTSKEFLAGTSEASATPIEVGAKESSDRPVSCLLGFSNPHATEGYVVSAAQPVRDDDRPIIGLDGEHSEVEESMDVGAEQQAILHMVGVVASIRLDVGRIEYIGHTTPGDHATASIGPKEGLPESTLALTSDDGSDCSDPGVMHRVDEPRCGFA